LSSKQTISQILLIEIQTFYVLLFAETVMKYTMIISLIFVLTIIMKIIPFFVIDL